MALVRMTKTLNSGEVSFSVLVNIAIGGQSAREALMLTGHEQMQHEWHFPLALHTQLS